VQILYPNVAAVKARIAHFAAGLSAEHSPGFADELIAAIGSPIPRKWASDDEYEAHWLATTLAREEYDALRAELRIAELDRYAAAPESEWSETRHPGRDDGRAGRGVAAAGRGLRVSVRLRLSRGVRHRAGRQPFGDSEQFEGGAMDIDMLLDEIGRPGATQVSVAEKYRLAILAERDQGAGIEWRPINEAIVERWGVRGLEHIKETAWSGITPSDAQRQRDREALLDALSRIR
jgi:hypothetical protein